MLSYFKLIYKLKCTYVCECKCIPKEEKVFFYYYLCDTILWTTFYCEWYKFVSGFISGLQTKVACEGV